MLAGRQEVLVGSPVIFSEGMKVYFEMCYSVKVLFSKYVCIEYEKNLQ